MTPNDAPRAQILPDTDLTHGVSSDAVADLHVRLRANAPRVHAMTNLVAQNFTANLLLAAGAVPSMTIAPDEVADFTARSGALLVNIGTLDPLLREAVPIAIAAASRAGRPWLLDPVLVDRSDNRLALARDLVRCAPAVVRTNIAEFEALAGSPASDETVAAFAAHHGCVVAVTGAVDLVSDGRRLARIANGHPLMGLVTAVGCAGTALIAGFAAIEEDLFAATVAGLVVLEVAGEIAARHARGPGSFQVALLDALHGLDRRTIVSRARLS